jgi:kynureninase
VNRELFDRIRERFYLPEGTLYFDGNSLGLLSRDAESEILRVVEEWKRLGVRGWLEADPPWFTLCESLATRVAPLVGASPGDVAVTGSTTGNIHALVSAFYRPEGRRRHILADPLNFPTDLYALRAQLGRAGADRSGDLRLVRTQDGRTLEAEATIAAMADDVALIFLPSVLYRSGQLLEMETITRAAREREIPIGWDLSHSIGVVPHALESWGADFAVWCHYKYLAAGPGAVAGLYVHPRHAGILPSLPGWWGNDKRTQFAMRERFEPATGAGRFQIGTPPILAVAALGGSLSIVEACGIEDLRTRSIALTSLLIRLIDERLPERETGFRVGSPRDAARRGGHVALEHDTIAARMNAALKARGVVPDFRPPGTIRLCPAPTITTESDVEAVVGTIREILDERAYEAYPSEPDPVA